MKQIYFAHLSDTHLNYGGKESFLKNNTTENLHKAFQYIQGLSDKMDFIIVTGDVAHEGDEQDYRYIKEIFSHYEEEMGVPILLTLGNHDNRQAFYKGYLGIESELPYMRSIEITGLRIILLDSKVGEHGISGELSQDQLKWLKKELENDAEYGTLIAFHHPPVNTILSIMDGHCLTNPEALKEVIINGDVIGILSGHTHFTNQCQFNQQILSSTADSTAFGMQVTPEMIRIVDNCSFNICAVKAKRLLVSNLHYSGAQILAELPQKAFAAMSKEYYPDEFAAISNRHG